MDKEFLVGIGVGTSLILFGLFFPFSLFKLNLCRIGMILWMLVLSVFDILNILKQETQITEKHLKKARTILELNRTEELIKGFTLQKKIVLLSLLRNEQADITNDTQNMYAVYQKLCSKLSVNILSQRRIAELIGELETAGILSTHVIYQGRYGRKRTMHLKSAHTIIGKALFQDKILAELKDLRLRSQKASYTSS